MVRRAILAIAVLGAVFLGAATARAAYPPLNVFVDADHPAGAKVPGDFLGLSFEAGALSQIAGYGDHGNLVAYMRSLGAGSMRFGGITVDTQAAWTENGRLPSWAITPITPADMANLGRLAAAAGWNVLLAVGLGHYDADAASREVAAASASLGPRLAGVEIGNEPHAFASKSLREQPWGFPQYQSEVDAYRLSIAARSPNIPLVGPDVGSGSGSWLRGEAATEHPRMLTAHYYSLGCHGAPPQVSDLLSTHVRNDAKRTLNHFANISQTYWLPFRIGEANNVSCGGKAGVSETFASALWALDFTERAMADGLAGVNFHGSIYNCHGYTPLCAKDREDLATGRLTANPEWYALLMLHQLVGDMPLTSWMSPRHRNVTVTAWASGGGKMHLLLINDGMPGSSHLTVRLRLPQRFVSGSILRLFGPSPDSTSGVLLGGRQVADNGVWYPPATLPKLRGRPGRLELRMAPASAALVTVFPHR